MKQIIIFSLCCLFSIVSIESTAQYTPQNVLKANVLGLGIGGFSLAYERAFTDNKSLLLTGRFMFFDFKDTKTFTFNGLGAVDVDYEVDLQLIGVLPEARFHLHSFFDRPAPEGFYVAPYFGFTRTKINAKSLTDNFTIAGGTNVSFAEIGGTTGYQFLIGEVITIDMFLGLGVTTFTLESVAVQVVSTTSSETVNDFVRFDQRLPLGTTLTGVLPRFGASIGLAF